MPGIPWSSGCRQVKRVMLPRSPLVMNQTASCLKACGVSALPQLQVQVGVADGR